MSVCEQCVVECVQFICAGTEFIFILKAYLTMWVMTLQRKGRGRGSTPHTCTVLLLTVAVHLETDIVKIQMLCITANRENKWV